MRTYELEDFPVGTTVHHKSNEQISMVVIEVNNEELICRWVDDKGVKIQEEFFYFEMIPDEEPGE
jgi:hypothetical protein